MADPASTFNSLSASLSLLHALSLHLKSNPTTPQPVLLETIQTLTSVRKALDEHLLTNEPAAVTAHLATLDKSLATLPPPLQASLKSNGLLPLLGTTQNSFTDLHTLSTTTETRTLQSLQRTALQIPPGHTFYSWFDQRPANSPPPLCHTSYTFKQAPPSGYTTLLNLLADVRSLERSKSFCKLLLTDTITTLKLETVDYSKMNFSYGSTFYQSYYKLQADSYYKEAIGMSKKLSTPPLILGSSLGLLNFYVNCTHGLSTVGIELLPSLCARAKKVGGKFGLENTFVCGDFMGSEYELYFRNTNLVVLTSMCWDEGLQDRLHAKLAELLPHGCTVVDYSSRLGKFKSESAEFECVSKVAVKVSWSDEQTMFVYVKKDINTGILPVTPNDVKYETEKKRKQVEYETEKKRKQVEKVAEPVLLPVTPVAKKEEPATAATPSAATPSAAKEPVGADWEVLQTPQKSDGSPVAQEKTSPVVAAVGVAAGVGICGMIMAKFWKK